MVTPALTEQQRLSAALRDLEWEFTRLMNQQSDSPTSSRARTLATMNRVVAAGEKFLVARDTRR